MDHKVAGSTQGRGVHERQAVDTSLSLSLCPLLFSLRPTHTPAGEALKEKSQEEVGRKLDLGGRHALGCKATEL